MKLLLLSNSTNAGEAYLEYPKNEIGKFLGQSKVKALFIPYAGVSIPYERYTAMVSARFKEIGHDLISIHTFAEPSEAVKNAEAIVVGGGNTFMLLSMLYKLDILPDLKEKVLAGTPFIGWSAGANIACPTICTTNDMPIIQPQSFNALNLIPFQINPHYTDTNPPGHAGETRAERINEFLEINRNVRVAGLREGTMFRVENDKIQLIGSRSARIFEHAKEAREIHPGDSIKFLMKE